MTDLKAYTYAELTAIYGPTAAKVIQIMRCNASEALAAQAAKQAKR